MSATLDASTATKKYLLHKLLIFWALLTFVGLLLLAAYYVGRTSSGQSFGLFGAFISQVLRFQIWAAMSVLVVAADRILRSKSQRWTFIFPLHVLISFAWAATALAIVGTLAWLFEGRTTSLGAVFASIWVANSVMGVFVYKIILTTNYALDYYRKFHAERDRNARLEIELAQAELSALKMQLQPHFLFNTLNSISHLALEDSRKAVQMIARLGDFLRLTIDNNGQQLVTFEREIEFLKNYLEIENIRFRDRMKVHFDIAANTLDVRVPNLILQPFVENAIKHGLAKSLAAGRIDITATRTGSRLLIEIANDGEMVEINGNGSATNGLGIQNTRDRLGRLYGDEFSLKIESNRAGGATVAIEIPVEAKNGGLSE
ncbi:MAG: histidine kinase [Pyrinomonadaceae bacterium]